jgi:low temperature requirement protein LtrA
MDMAIENSLLRNLVPPLHPRDPDEHHRAATPLELLFDLVSVIAIASAAAGLHHAISEAHVIEGLLSFGMAFFAIWWAWMNFTWFASAYDNDDTVYRLLTMVIMGGALVVAAGIPSIFEEQPDFTMVIIGYVIMRVAMTVLWLRAGCADTAHRRTALAYALGIALVQVYWVAFLLVQPLSGPVGYGMWLVGFVLELSVPAIAEPLTDTTPWHRHHIVERYGLLVIIVLGETLLSGSLALRQSAEHFNIMLVHTALSALVIVFALWWLYFTPDPHLHDRNLRRALIWGYGHFIIFASGAAIGAGFGVLVDVITAHSKVSILVGDYAVALPVAIFVGGLWIVRDRYTCQGAAAFVLPVCAVLVVLAPAVGLGLEGVAAVAVLTACLRSWTRSSPSAPGHPSP